MKKVKILLIAAMMLCLLTLPSCGLLWEQIFGEAEETGEPTASPPPNYFEPTDNRYAAAREGYVLAANVQLLSRNYIASMLPAQTPPPSQDAPPEGETAASEQPAQPTETIPEFEEIEVLEKDELVTLLGTDIDDLYYVALTQRGTSGYIRADSVAEYDPETMYTVAHIPDEGVNQATLVLLETVVPGIKTDQRLAQEGNYLRRLTDPEAEKHPPYLAKDWVLVDKKAALKLAKARSALAAEGYDLAVVGGYYPQSIQYTLYNAIGDPDIVPNPKDVSRSAQGAAVDVVLLDARGEQLDFPTPVHTFTKAAARPFAQAGQSQRQNAQILLRAMQDAGFTAAEENWWQFYDAESGFIISNIRYESMTLKAAPIDWTAAPEE
ncbi:MAG: hypothetical protein LBR85_00580 [Oscillospiraceae bacterium]|jgi:D-alanyl-D-alanine dipeptidase|nr:hypothetical protein [Oscillospiraceae bacterium]